jgi:predicted ABC-type transport system involved in lysophospholipase L1 biosynthesis ATPase subunit
MIDAMHFEPMTVGSAQATAETDNIMNAHARATAEAENILEVRDLNVAFRAGSGAVHAVRDVSFSVRRGETLALVGETSSGKSVTCLGLLGLTPPAPYCTITGSARLAARNGKTYELVGTSEHVMRQVRGGVASVIFQEPMTSLNPVHTVGAQICESLRIHLGMQGRAAMDRAAELLNQVGISDPKRRLANYPHELSGGMRQRALAADRRRAHHGPRCHHSGADPGIAAEAAVADPDGHDLHHAQPRNSRRDRGPRDGDVRGPDRRESRCRGALHRAPASL